jgi:hypothetical protein
MATFTISYDPVTDRDDDTVIASYHRPSDLGDFVEFKDESHAVVFAVRSAYVVSIRRSAAGHAPTCVDGDQCRDRGHVR